MLYRKTINIPQFPLISIEIPDKPSHFRRKQHQHEAKVVPCCKFYQFHQLDQMNSRKLFQELLIQKMALNPLICLPKEKQHIFWGSFLTSWKMFFTWIALAKTELFMRKLSSVSSILNLTKPIIAAFSTHEWAFQLAY